MTLSRTAYTDYPLDVNLPDGTVLEVQVLSYDRNKYAKISYNQQVFEVKSGYIFKDSALCKRFNAFFWYSLPTEPEGARVSRIKTCQMLRRLKSRKTSYTVYSHNRLSDPEMLEDRSTYTVYEHKNRKSFKSLKRALNSLAPFLSDLTLSGPQCHQLVKEQRSGWCSRIETLLVVDETGPALIYSGKTDRTVIKTKTLQKIQC